MAGWGGGDIIKVLIKVPPEWGGSSQSGPHMPVGAKKGRGEWAYVQHDAVYYKASYMHDVSTDSELKVTG